MFSIDFPEVVIIFGVALVVLGPKKLPGTAAQIGRWVGRARAMARQFREQLEQEVSSVESALDTRDRADPVAGEITPTEQTTRAPASEPDHDLERLHDAHMHDARLHDAGVPHAAPAAGAIAGVADAPELPLDPSPAPDTTGTEPPQPEPVREPVHARAFEHAAPVPAGEPESR